MAKRKRKPGRKPLRVKIEGNPLPLIDRMLGKGGSSPKPEEPAKKAKAKRSA